MLMWLPLEKETIAEGKGKGKEDKGFNSKGSKGKGKSYSGKGFEKG